MKKLQIEGLTGKALLAAIKADDEIVVCNGDEPVARVMPVRVELAARQSFFVHYPHEASECFHTCWRHDGHAEEEATAEVQTEPETAAV